MKSEWKIMKLKNVLQDKGYIRGPFGSALKRSDMLEDGIPVYEQQHAIHNNRDFRFYIDKAKFEKLKRFQVCENDLLISCSGTIGKVTIVNNNDPKGIISQALLILRANTKIVLPKFLKYFFLTKKGYNSIVSRSTGSVQVNIAKRNIIEDILISVPPIYEQERIVRIIDSIERKILLNQQINDNLEKQAQCIFANAVDTSKSTKFLELKNIAQVKGGKRLPKGNLLISTRNDHPYIRICNLNNNFYASLDNNYEYVEDEIQNKIARYTVKSNDILLSIVGTIGLSAIVDKTLNMANLTENCVKITDLKLIYPEYLLLFLRSKYGSNEIEKNTVGAVQKKLPLTNIQAFKIPVLEEQKLNKLKVIFQCIFEQISNNLLEIANLTELRDILIANLLSKKGLNI